MKAWLPGYWYKNIVLLALSVIDRRRTGMAGGAPRVYTLILMFCAADCSGNVWRSGRFLYALRRLLHQQIFSRCC